MDLHDPRLADAVGAVGGLVLDRRIPPAVEVEDVARGRQVEAEPAGAQRHDEHARVPIRFLEAVDDSLALRPRRRPVEVEPLDLELPLHVAGEQAAHHGVLREDEGRVALGERLGEHLGQPVELAGAPGKRTRPAERVERMVADLLQACDEREHVAAALDPRRAADIGHHRVDRRLVERGLLDRERAVLRRVLPGRQVGQHVRVDLAPAQQEGPRHPDERLLGLRVGAALDRRGDQAAKAGARPEEAGVQDVHDRPQVVEPVLDGRAGERDPVARGDRARRLRRPGERVLDRLGLVERQHPPSERREEAAIAGQERVGGEHDVPDLQVDRFRRAVRAVVDHGAQAGGESVQLPLPVAEHGRRADDQGGPVVLVTAVEQVGDQLDGLAEAHVVGEQRPKSELAHAHEPAQARLLVRTQEAVEPGRRLHRPAQGRVAQLRCQAGQIAVGLDHAHDDAAHVRRSRQRGAERRHGRHPRAVQRRRRQRAGARERLGVERPPLAAEAHERLRRGGQGAQLLDADLVAAERGLEVVADDAVELERSAGKLEPGIVEVEIALLRHLGRQLHPGAGELERRGGQAQLDDRVLAEQHDAVGDAAEGREHMGRAAPQRGVVRGHGQRPGARRVDGQLEPQLQRRQRVAQAHHRRRHPQVGSDGPQERLQHAQIDPGHLDLAGAQDLRLADGGREGVHARVDEPGHGRLGCERRRLLLFPQVVDDGVAGLRKRGREPAQVGDGAAAEHGRLDDPRRQPPRPHRGTRPPVPVGEQIGQSR